MAAQYLICLSLARFIKYSYSKTKPLMPMGSPRTLEGVILRREKVFKNFSVQIHKNKKDGYYSLRYNTQDILDWIKDLEVLIKRRFGSYSSEAKSLEEKTRKDKFFLSIATQAELVGTLKYVKERKGKLEQRIREIEENYLKSIKKTYPQKREVLNFRLVPDLHSEVSKLVYIDSEIKNKMIGNIISQAIVKKLWKLCQDEGLAVQHHREDDLQKLAEKLKNKTKNRKLKLLLASNFTKVTLADRARNKSCHAYEKAPSKHELGVALDLWRIL